MGLVFAFRGLINCFKLLAVHGEVRHDFLT